MSRNEWTRQIDCNFQLHLEPCYALVHLTGLLIMYLENPDIGWLISYNKSPLLLTLNVGLEIEVVNNSYLGEAVFVSFSYLVNISLPGLIFLINKLKIFSIKIVLKSHFHFLCNQWRWNFKRSKLKIFWKIEKYFENLKNIWNFLLKIFR